KPCTPTRRSTSRTYCAESATTRERLPNFSVSDCLRSTGRSKSSRSRSIAERADERRHKQGAATARRTAAATLASAYADGLGTCFSLSGRRFACHKLEINPGSKARQLLSSELDRSPFR